MVDDPSQRRSGVLVAFGSTTRPQAFPQRQASAVSFDREELRTILNVYGRKVAAGEWRDYAIDHGAGCAFFSVFRHSYDRPLFSVAKHLRPDNKSVDFLLLAGPRQLATDSSLPDLRKRFEKKIKVVS